MDFITTNRAVPLVQDVPKRPLKIHNIKQ